MASPDMMIDVDALPRAESKIERHHGKFLLKELSFTQQFSHMYFGRLGRLTSKAIGAVKASSAHPHLQHSRILQLKVGERALIVGTLYKQMSSVTPFLREYTKELVKLAEGVGEDEDDGVDDGEDLAEGADVADAAVAATSSGTGTLVSESDLLIVEDDSGRVELLGQLRPADFVTGVVLAIVGTLEAKGKLVVEEFVFPAAPPAPSRALATRAEPCWVGFLCGLDVESVGETAFSASLLVDYLSGNFGGDDTVAEAACIARLVVGGNLISPTDDSRLKNKIRLEPTDHIKPNFANRTVSTSANGMRHADALLRRLAASVDVEVMPGEHDATNCYWPQQPIHPLLLKTASRQSTVKLVSNPYEFSVTPGAAGGAGATRCIVTSGQNVTDMVCQSSMTPLAAMQASLEWSLLCPTAPNSLCCYPYKDTDPFVVEQRPHLYVACNMDRFETEVVRPPASAAAAAPTRLVTVPSFRRTGKLVLVDINSPSLNTKVMCFGAGTD